MNKKLYRSIATATLIGAAVANASAQNVAQSDTTATQSGHESIFQSPIGSLAASHFTWGADIGASIDINGYDMSTFDLDIVLGYKNDLLKTLGISAGIHRDFHTGTTFVPVEAVVRTAFIPRPCPIFMNLKAGYSFNTVGDSPTKGGFIFNAGIGFNLYRSQRVQTHLLLSYQFIHLNEMQGTMIDKKENHVDMIQVAFGVNF